jgi:hypothetical protein
MMRKGQMRGVEIRMDGPYSQHSRILILRYRIFCYPIDFIVMEGRGDRGGVQEEHLLSLILPLKEGRTQRFKLHQVPIKEAL